MRSRAFLFKGTMTTQSTNNKDIYTFNGVTTEWPITFETNGISADEILLYHTDADGASVLVTENYTVDLDALKVVYPSVASGLPAYEASDGGVVLLRTVDLLQGTDFKNQGPLPAEVIELSLDRFSYALAQLQEQLDRTAQADVSGSDADPEVAALLAAVAEARDDAEDAAASALASKNAAQLSANQAASHAVDWATSLNAASVYADNARVSANQAALSASSALLSANQAAALVGASVPTGAIVMWSGALASIPSGWALCDGNNGTPNLLQKMIVCVASATAPGEVTGDAYVPPHQHNLTTKNASDARIQTTDDGPGVSGTTYIASSGSAVIYALAYIMKT